MARRHPLALAKSPNRHMARRHPLALAKSLHDRGLSGFPPAMEGWSTPGGGRRVEAAVPAPWRQLFRRPCRLWSENRNGLVDKLGVVAAIFARFATWVWLSRPRQASTSGLVSTRYAISPRAHHVRAVDTRHADEALRPHSDSAGGRQRGARKPPRRCSVPGFSGFSGFLGVPHAPALLPAQSHFRWPESLLSVKR